MAKKQTAAKIEVFEFDDIHRGTSMTLPIIIRKSDGTRFDLTGYTALFTLKPAQSDFDYDDDRGLITKEFEPYTGDPNKVGRIDITLTSKELWVTPGLYYFDVVLMNGFSSQRILLASTNIVGGPTNRNVRHEQSQEDFFLHDPIEISPSSSGRYIAVQVPFVTDPPENIVEGIVGDPQYAVQQLDDPHRHVLIRNYGPRVSLMMTLRVAHDHTVHRHTFDSFFLNGSLPAPCPLKGGKIEFCNRKVKINLKKEMDMMYSWFGVQHNHGPQYDLNKEHPEYHHCKPEVPINEEKTFDAGYGSKKSSEPFYIGDRIEAGKLTLQLRDGNDQIHMTADFHIPDDDGGFMYWMIRIDWFNWVDPYEPDPEREDVSTHFPTTSFVDNWEGYWPPDMWYCYHDGKKE